MQLTLKPVNWSHAQQKVIFAFIGLTIILILILSAYSNTLNSPVVLDDTHSFVDEPLVQNFDWSLPSVIGLSQTKFGWARFIPMLTLAHDQWSGEGRLVSFHITNITIHLLVTLVVFFWSTLLFRLARQDLSEESSVDDILAALAVTGIWALVPVQTNAVTYIVQRMASLVTLFYLLAFTCYFYGRINWLLSSRKTALIYWFFTFLATVCAFMSKENSVTLPVMIVLGEVLFFRSQFYAALLRHKKIVIILAIVFLVFVFTVIYRMMPSILLSYDHRHFTLGERLLTESRVVISYICLLIFPWPASLCLDHHVPLSHSLLTPVSTLFSCSGLLLLLILAWMWRRRFPLLTFGLSWFLCNLILESSIIALELKFEHRLYLPSCGFYVFLVGGCIICGRSVKVVRDRRFWTALVLTVCAVLSLMTYVRNRTWADTVTIYEDCVVKAFPKPRVHSNLSKAYSSIGLHKKAISEAEKAIELGIYGYEEYWVAACNMIAAYSKLGLEDEAFRRGEELLSEAPAGAKINAKPIFLRNLAFFYLHRGEYKKAYDTLYSALALLFRTDLPYLPTLEMDMLMVLEKVREKSNDTTLEQFGLSDRKKSSVLLAMAEIFFKFGDYVRTREYADQVLRLNDNREACQKLLSQLDNIEKANIRQIQYGTMRDNYLKKFWQNSFNLRMAVVYVIEKYQLPIDILGEELLRQARQLRSESPDPWLLASWHYYMDRKYDKAIAAVQKGLQLDENYAQLWVNLGMYQLADKQPRQALTSLLKALQLYPGYPRKAEVESMIAAARKKLL